MPFGKAHQVTDAMAVKWRWVNAPSPVLSPAAQGRGRVRGFSPIQKMVRAAGLEPARGEPQQIFLPTTAFAATFKKGFVVWTIPSP